MLRLDCGRQSRKKFHAPPQSIVSPLHSSHPLSPLFTLLIHSRLNLLSPLYTRLIYSPFQLCWQTKIQQLPIRRRLNRNCFLFFARYPSPVRFWTRVPKPTQDCLMNNLKPAKIATHNTISLIF